MKSLSLVVLFLLQSAILQPIYQGTSLAQSAVQKTTPAPILFNLSAPENDPQSGESQIYHLSIPASAFTPGTGYYDYQNHGRFLKYFGNPYNSDLGGFNAPVQLPQGAVITKMVFYFKDPGAGTANAWLLRAPHFSLGSTSLASLDSTDLFPPSFGVASTSSFTSQPVIDNSQYTYSVQMNLPPGGVVWGCGVELEYTLPNQPVSPGILNFPPAAFNPFEDGYAYALGAAVLTHNAGPGVTPANGWYLAPVNLPDGSIVSRVTFYWRRNDATVVATARLQRTRLGFDTYEDMAVVSSSTGMGDFTSSTADTTINSPLIDNTQYAYWVVLDMPAAGFPATALVEMRDVEIEYQLPVSPQNHLSIPAAGFRSYEDGYDYQDHGRHLFHTHSPGSGTANGWYLTPLHLPDGVLINNLDFYAYLDSSQPGVAHLQRTEWGSGNYQDLAVISTDIGNPGNKLFSTNTVAGGPVDNAKYGYWIVWDLPANALSGVNVQAQAMRISYGARVHIPLVIK